MGKLLSDFTAKPEHIPVCFLRIEAGDGGGRRPGSKNEFAAQSKTTQRGEGRESSARTRPSPAGAVCCPPGCESQTWQSAQLSGRAGGGGGAAHVRSRRLGTPMGVWIFFWAGWFSPVGRSDSWVYRMGSGGTGEPQMWHKVSGIWDPNAWGARGARGELLPSANLSTPTRKVREKRKSKAHHAGGHLGTDQGGTFSC